MQKLMSTGQGLILRQILPCRQRLPMQQAVLVRARLARNGNIPAKVLSAVVALGD
jgi:hypothetical protein